MTETARAVPVEVKQKFSQMREDLKKLAGTIQDVEAQQAEYTIALGAIEKLPAERKCFRLVGQALVEHTVGEVTPAIKDRRDQLTNLYKGLSEQLDKLENQATKYAIENGLVRYDFQGEFWSKEAKLIICSKN